MKGCIVIVSVLCLLACVEDDSTPRTDNTVHLAGFIATQDGVAVAGYWKDNSYSNLPSDSTYSNVHSMYVDGASVLIGGWKRGTPPRAVIWRDGTENSIDGSSGGTTLVASRDDDLFAVWNADWEGPVFLRNGSVQPIADTALNIGPSGLALLGDDMYVSGCSSYHDWTSPNAKTYQHAQCWKNGELIFRESQNSNALSIFIHEHEIYMAGHLYTPEQSIGNACYWKNGQRVDLTDGNVMAVAKSIFVTNEHVYAAGMIDNQAVYWKDGEAIYLTTEGPYSMANSIFVKGSDVHVGGYEQGHPAYWKNDVRQTIKRQDRLGQVLFVVVGSN
jgi:hypothetical protein